CVSDVLAATVDVARRCRYVSGFVMNPLIDRLITWIAPVPSPESNPTRIAVPDDMTSGDEVPDPSTLTVRLRDEERRAYWLPLAVHVGADEHDAPLVLLSRRHGTHPS